MVALLFSSVSAALPPVSTPFSPTLASAAGEVLDSPRYVAAAVMPNGEVGLIFQNLTAGVAEIRFKRYTTERSTDASIQLSTAGPSYPRLTTFQGKLVAAYVDTRAPNAGRLVVRTSADSGASWSTESYPLAGATFDTSAFAPQVVASRDGNSLYVFSAASGAIPQYQVSTDATLATWSALTAAGDSTMRLPSGNNCGSAGAECYRAHAFGFTETALAGRWLYITKSDSGYGQSGRGTQYGTLGGAWSTQVDQLGSGGISGGGDSTATAFVDRDGDLVFVRAEGYGGNAYWIRSTDDGATWSARTYAYSSGTGNYWTGAPVGLYVPGYSQGEYVWWAGFGGTEDTVRVVGLWRVASAYLDSGTARLFGSAGGDWDEGWAYPYNFGERERSLAVGNFTTSATDLALPGRRLPFAFSRSYNSADHTSGPLGPGWTHSYNWNVTENGDVVALRRGDGRTDRYTKNPDATYATPPGVFDRLTKNPNLSFTLTLTDQTTLEFNPATPGTVAAGALTKVREPAGNELTLAYTGSRLRSITDTVGRVTSFVGAAGDNLALGKSYTMSVAPKSWYPDTGGVELTDGQIADGWDPWVAAWQGHENPASPVDVTIDLGSEVPIGLARSIHMHDQNNNIYRPSSVEFLTSNDNIAFTSRGSVASASATNPDGDRRWYYDVSVNVTARYLRARLTATPSTWMWSTEIQAFRQDDGPLGLPLGMERIGSLRDSTGRRVTYRYDSTGRLSTVTDTLGNTAGQVPSAHRWTYTYEGTTRHLATITDPDGRVALTNTYDGSGRLATTKDGLNNQSSFAYSSGQTVITTPRTHAITQTFDPRKRLLSEAVSLGGLTKTQLYEYDSLGNRNALIDREGHRTDLTYDSRGNLLTVVAPQLDPQTPRATVTNVYDSKNNLTSTTDARGFEATAVYDATTNLLLSKTAEPTQTTTVTTKYQYTDPANPGLVTRIITPRGNTTGTPDNTYSTTFAYDASGNLVTVIDADGAKTTHSYDPQGRRTASVDPDGYAAGATPSQHTWTTAYDALDRVLSAADPIGNLTSSTYDGAGNRTTMTDKNGQLTTYIYDAAGRLWKVRQKPDPVGQPALTYETLVTRDANGNAATLTRANGVLTDYAYDALDRLTSLTTHPTTTTTLTTSYVLDGRGLATSRTAGNNQVVNSVYDAMGRLTQVSASGLATISYAYDAGSLRTGMTDGTGTSTYSYDGLGRLTQAAQPNGTTSYGYDPDSNLTTLGYPTVGSVGYAYSSGGRLGTVTDWASRVSSYTYTAQGQAKTASVPGGMTTTYIYDRADRLTNLTNMVGSTTISSHAYTLDSEGNRTALDEIVSGLMLPPVQPFASVKVNSDAGTTVQDRPSIALGADAATYLIWEDARLGNADIEFARRDPATGAWGANVKVNTDATTRIQLNPSIALDASDNAYAVWDDQRDGASNKIDRNIYFSKRLAGTGSWSTPNLRLNTDTTGNPVQRNPRISATGSGTLAAVWVDLRSSQQNIQSRRSTDGAATWSANLQVTDNTAALKDLPDVVVGADGTAYAVWQDSRNGNADIYFSKLLVGTSTWTANVKASDDPGSAAQTAPRLGLDGAGNLTLVWLDARTTPATIRMSRQLAGTSTWTASTLVTDAAARPTAPIALSVRPDGNAYAAWGDTRAANTDIWAAQYTAATGSWATSQLLSDDPGSAAQSSPSLVYTTGELASAWRDDRAGNADVRARRTAYNPAIHSFGMSYDGLERLQAVSGTVPEGFTLDPGSNLASRSGPAKTFSYDMSDRLTGDGSSTFSWDGADRLTGRGADIFGYDPLARLVSSTVTGIPRSYAYNGDGLLQSHTQGTTTALLWDPATSLARLLAIGTGRIVYGLGPLYGVQADGTTVTFARDGQKSIRAEVSSAGTVTNSFRYTAYGDLQAASPTAAIPTFLAYNGQLRDNSRLLYLRARWYDPASARFITRDPQLGVSQQPASLNAFAYGHANPMRFSDPSGQCPMCWGAVFGFVGYWAITTFVTREEFDPAQALIATATGAATGGVSTFVKVVGLTGGAAVGANFFGGAVVGTYSGGVSLLAKAIGNETIVSTDEAKIISGSAASALAAVLGPPAPSGRGAVSAALIAANAVVASGYEWLQEQASNWITR